METSVKAVDRGMRSRSLLNANQALYAVSQLRFVIDEKLLCCLLSRMWGLSWSLQLLR